MREARRFENSTRRRVQDMPDRVFQSRQPIHFMDNDEITAVGRPIHAAHVFEEVARSAAGQGYTPQRALLACWEPPAAVPDKREVSGARDRLNRGGRRQTERSRLDGITSCRKNLEREAVPSRTVQDRLT